MNGIKRAVMSGVLVAGMGLQMIAAVPAAAQSGYGRPYPGQYASDYYGNNGYYSNNGYYNNGYRSGYYDNGYRGGYYDNGYRNNSSYYYNNRYNGVGPGKGAVIGGAAGVILGGLLGGGKGALIGGAAGAGIGAAAGAANRDSHRYDGYGYRGY